MKTKIFQTYRDFLKREDETENGVSPQFAENNPNYEEINNTNEGCWNCTDCTDCDYCTDCTSCRDCRSCKDCTSCRYCVGCRYCEDCTDCVGCRHCTGLKDLILEQHQARNKNQKGEKE